jgi:hypothetical protein
MPIYNSDEASRKQLTGGTLLEASRKTSQEESAATKQNRQTRQDGNRKNWYEYFRSGDSTRSKTTDTQDEKVNFLLKSTKIHIFMEVIVLPPSFNYWNENKFLTHYYSTNVKTKLESGKEPHPI